MAHDIKTLTCEAGPAGDKRRGFHPFASMAEGIRNARAKRSAIELFDSAMRFGEKEGIDEALASFAALAPKQREGALIYLQDSLRSCSDLPFENECKTRRVTVIAKLFEGAAKTLPVDSEGERIVSPYHDAILMLKNVVENDDLRISGKGEHAGAMLACVKALWELEYGNLKFWDARTRDSATSAYAITKLLEMPDCGEFGEHGWSLLRDNLDALGISIAATGSPKAVPFFRSMLMDGDKSVVNAALKGALYLEPVPAEFFDMAGDIAKIPGLEGPASDFIAAGHFKMILEPESENGLMAMRQLAYMHFGGMEHLAPMLATVGREIMHSALASNGDEAKRIKKIEALLHLGAAGIMPYDGEKLARLLSPLVDSPGAAGTLYNLTGIIIMKSADAGLVQAAKRIETERMNARVAEIDCADTRQFDAALELVRLLATGRSYLLESGIIGRVMNEMVDVAYRPGGPSEAEKAAQRRGAVGVMRELAKFGMGVTMQPASPDGVFTPEELARAKELQDIFAEYSAEAGEEPAGQLSR
ncbi:hypothetical protein L0Y65_04975 [Candidatus Micrarchaeota archaeon]|nr:hypothetical protein [Candidatus Micrarchaeota archaeon]